MKTIKNKELAQLPAEELQRKLAEVRAELMRDNAQVGMRTVPKSPGLLKANKKMAARIIGLLHAKENIETIKKSKAQKTSSKKASSKTKVNK